MMKKAQVQNKITLQDAIKEDPLIVGLLAARGAQVEVIAFGLAYVGELEMVDPDDGVIVISDGVQKAVLEIERIESFTKVKL